MSRRVRRDEPLPAHGWWVGNWRYRVYRRQRGVFLRLTPPYRAGRDRWAIFPRQFLTTLSLSEFEVMASKFLPPKAQAGPKVPVFLDTSFKEEFPLLASWLNDPLWGDGKTPRTPSTLIIFMRNGMFSGGLINKDSDPEMTLWGLGQTLNELCACLEELLNDPGAPWTPSRSSGANGKKRK
jgi:hypothetical protein